MIGSCKKRRTGEELVAASPQGTITEFNWEAWRNQ